MSDQPSVTPSEIASRVLELDAKKPSSWADADLIAEYCTAAPELARAYQQLEQENATLRVELDECLKLLATRVEASRLDEATATMATLREQLDTALAECVDIEAKALTDVRELRELAEKLAATVDITVEIARTGWGDRDAGISTALDQADRNLASYRAACPGEGQPSSASNSPTASRESQG